MEHSSSASPSTSGRSSPPTNLTSSRSVTQFPVIDCLLLLAYAAVLIGRIAGFVCPSVCPSVPHGLLTQKQKDAEKLKFNFPSAVTFAGPSAWNSLPTYLNDHTLNLDSFKRFLKSFLFQMY